MTDTIAAFLGALAQTEYLPPARLQRYQRDLLERLVRHARAETGFYPDRLAGLFRGDGSIDWEAWSDIPVLSRADTVGRFAELAARSTVENAGEAIEDTTSGSSGVPLHHLTSQIQSVATACANERFMRWHGIDPARVFAAIQIGDDPASAFPHGQMTRGWRLQHPESVGMTLTVSSTPVERQLEWVTRVKPAYLLSYPSNLAEMARLAAGAGTRIEVDAVLTFGEMTTPDARQAIVEHFGRTPLDRYGATESGLIACTCPDGHLHVMSELVLVEIAGEDGRLVPAGTVGRVIVTPLYNHAMPFIRYDIGDYAAMSPEPCTCGRTLPVLSAIYGRARNIFRFNDGSSVWPLVGAKAVQRFVRHRQYQLVQVTRERLELRYVPLSADQVNDAAGFTDYVRRRLHPSLSVELVPVSAIPRSAGGKYEDCLSLVR